MRDGGKGVYFDAVFPERFSFVHKFHSLSGATGRLISGCQSLLLAVVQHSCYDVIKTNQKQKK